MERSIPVFHLFGIEVRAHWSWLILAFLVAASLATGWFPELAPGLGAAAYWSAALVCTLGLFASIVIHEFCHALVGRRYKMKVERITMFLFGGVAHLNEEPESPKAEFLMAAAGPAASLVLAFAFDAAFNRTAQSPPLVHATYSYLASINLVVAAFNLLPGYPLDGGRILRAALWQFKKDLLWATKIASAVGQFFGIVLIALGLATLFRGQGISGVWSMLLGFLLMGFARTSYVQLLIKRDLHGRPAAVFMDPLPQTVTPDTPLSIVMKGFMNHPETTVLPVVEDDRFLGCVDAAAALRFPEGEWAKHRVREITRACESDHQIEPETDAESALMQMVKTGYRELLVVKGGRLVGLLTQAALRV